MDACTIHFDASKRYLNHRPHALQAYSSLHIFCQDKSRAETWLSKADSVPLRRRIALIPIGVPSYKRPDLINTSSTESTHTPPQCIPAYSKNSYYLTPPSLFRRSCLSHRDIFHASGKQRYSRHAQAAQCGARAINALKSINASKSPSLETFISLREMTIHQTQMLLVTRQRTVLGRASTLSEHGRN